MKTQIIIEAIDKTRKGVQSARKSLSGATKGLNKPEPMGGVRLNKPTGLEKVRMRNPYADLGRNLAKTVGDALRDGIKKTGTKIGTAVGKVIEKPVVQKIVAPIRENVIKPYQQQQRQISAGQAMYRGGVNSSSGFNHGGESATGGSINRLAGAFAGFGAAVAIPAGMAYALGKRHNELVAEQAGSNRMTGEGYYQGIGGIRGADVHAGMASYARASRGGGISGADSKDVASLQGRYGLSADAAGSLLGNFGGKDALTKMLTQVQAKGGVGGRAKEAQLLEHMSQQISEGVAKGMRPDNAKGMAAGMAYIYGARMGKEGISASRAGQLNAGLNSSLQGAASLEGGMKEGIMFDAVRRSMGADGSDLMKVLAQLEKGTGSKQNVTAVEQYLKDQYGEGSTGYKLARMKVLGTSAQEEQGGIKFQGGKELRENQVNKDQVYAAATGRLVKSENIAIRAKAVGEVVGDIEDALLELGSTLGKGLNDLVVEVKKVVGGQGASPGTAMTSPALAGFGEFMKLVKGGDKTVKPATTGGAKRIK